MARSIVRAVCVLALTHALAHAWVSPPAPRPTVLRSAPTDSPADVDAAPGADLSAGPRAELDLARAAEAIPPPSPSSGNPVWQLDLVRAEALCVAAGAAAPALGALRALSVAPPGGEGGGAWDAIVDARSPSEFDEDAVPGAINRPASNDAQRHRVGTVYASDPFERAARRSLVASNLAATLAAPPFGPGDAAAPSAPLGARARVCVYCWRGGERSGSLAHTLSRVGWHVASVKGGWREYRRLVARRDGRARPLRARCRRRADGQRQGPAARRARRARRAGRRPRAARVPPRLDPRRRAGEAQPTRRASSRRSRTPSAPRPRAARSSRPSRP